MLTTTPTTQQQQKQLIDIVESCIKENNHLEIKNECIKKQIVNYHQLRALKGPKI